VGRARDDDIEGILETVRQGIEEDVFISLALKVLLNGGAVGLVDVQKRADRERDDLREERDGAPTEARDGLGESFDGEAKVGEGRVLYREEVREEGVGDGAKLAASARIKKSAAADVCDLGVDDPGAIGLRGDELALQGAEGRARWRRVWGAA